MPAHILNCAVGILWIPLFILLIATFITAGLRITGKTLSIIIVPAICFGVSWILVTLKCIFFGLIFDDKIGFILGNLFFLAMVFSLVTAIVVKDQKWKTQEVLEQDL